MKRRIYTVAILFIGIIACSNAQVSIAPVSKIKTGCVSGNCDEGQGIYVWDDGSVYIGTFKNKIMEGHGNYFYKNGDCFTGNFKDSKPDSIGTFYTNSGSKYFGMMKVGIFDGFGIYYTPEGAIYRVGKWINNEKQEPYRIPIGCITGNCIDKYSIYNSLVGDHYEGSFKDSLMDGYGYYYSAIGDSYIGEFKKGKYDGKGSLYYANGEWYDGEFKEGLFNGRGTYFNKDGSVSDYGQWTDGKKADQTKNTFGCIYGDCGNGYGIFVWDMGARYEGNFKNGTMDGVGSYRDKNGEGFQGQWKAGKIEGYGVYHYRKSNTWYIGQVNNGNCEGYGVVYNSDGSVNFVGQFIGNNKVDNQPQGGVGITVERDGPKDFPDAINQIVEEAPENFKGIRSEKDSYGINYKSKFNIPGCEQGLISKEDNGPSLYVANILKTLDMTKALEKYNSFKETFITNKDKINKGANTQEETKDSTLTKFSMEFKTSVKILTPHIDEKGERQMVNVWVSLICYKNFIENSYYVEIIIKNSMQ